MTETQSGSGSADSNQIDWNRQASTVDWEGWIAEENAADAQRAQAAASTEATVAPAPFPAAQLNYPASNGQSIAGYPAPGGYPPPGSYPAPAGYPAPTGYPAAPGAFAAGYPPAPGSAYGYSSPDGHPMPQGYAQPGASFPAGRPFQAVPPTRRPLDAVSVLALIFGILPTFPVGFILGIVGIVRTANPVRRGRSLAVTGLVLSLAWVVVVVVGLPRYVNGPDAQRDAAGTVTKAATVSPAKLRKGDCYNHAALSTAPGQVNAISVVPCGQPHNSVVFATGTMPAGSWTTSDDMLARAGQQCIPMARAYFNGYQVNPRIRIAVLFAAKTEWNLGNRFLRCVAMDPDKTFVGDIRQDR